MSKPTREFVPWADVVEAAKMVGIEALPTDIAKAEALEMFGTAVDNIANATPEGQEPDLDPMVIDVFNNAIIFKVPVTGHPSEPEEAPAPAAGGEEVVETPVEEPGKKTKKVEKEAEKARKKAEKEAAKKKKAEEKAKKKAESTKPGAREKDSGYAAVLRAGILAKDPEGVVIQKCFEEYKKNIPEGKDEKWALARAKRTYHHVYAILVKQGRIEPKPKPEPKPKEEPATEGEAAAAAE
jgi:hypothetical protein